MPPTASENASPPGPGSKSASHSSFGYSTGSLSSTSGIPPTGGSFPSSSYEFPSTASASSSSTNAPGYWTTNPPVGASGVPSVAPGVPPGMNMPFLRQNKQDWRRRMPGMGPQNDRTGRIKSDEEEDAAAPFIGNI